MRETAGNGRTYFLAGGGSGGHLYPGLAVAQALRQLDEDAQVVFLTTERDIDARILGKSGLAYHAQPILPLPRRPDQFLDFYRRWRATIRLCRELIEQYQPVAVLGLGGYASGAAMNVAAKVGLARAMLNPDAVPGIANRFCRRYAQEIYVQWAQSVAHFGRHGGKCIVTGCPVRTTMVDHAGQATSESSEQVHTQARQEARTRLGLAPEKSTLVIVGGSQGGQSLNAAVVEWLTGQTAPGRHRPGVGWQVLHLSGPAEQEWVQQAYDQAAVGVQVMGYCDHMEWVWAAADLVISRAGASALAELTALGVPSLLMPYPHHRDQHQRRNAQILADVGAAKIVEDSGISPKTADALAHLWHDIIEGHPTEGSTLNAMRRQAHTLGRPQAAQEIARRLRHLATTP